MLILIIDKFDLFFIFSPFLFCFYFFPISFEKEYVYILYFIVLSIYIPLFNFLFIFFFSKKLEKNIVFFFSIFFLLCSFLIILCFFLNLYVYGIIINLNLYN
jgi:hypothetical protein